MAASISRQLPLSQTSRRHPAAWSAVDRSVVITHPSASAGARFSSPATDPALRWRENNQSSAVRAAWLSAVHRALEVQSAAVGAPFQAPAAFHDTSTLLHGTRQPATVEGQAVLAALPNTLEDAPTFLFRSRSPPKTRAPAQRVSIRTNSPIRWSCRQPM
jgi:hypothetical protein